MAQNNWNGISRTRQRKIRHPDIIGNSHTVQRGGVGDVTQISRRRVNHHRIAQRQQTLVINLHRVGKNVVQTQTGRWCIRHKGHGFNQSRHRKRNHRCARVNVGIARRSRVRIFAPRTGNQRAVHRKNPHACLIFTRVKNFQRLQRRNREIRVVVLYDSIICVAQRPSVVALVIHIQRRVRQCRNPNGTAIHRAVRTARSPTDGRFSGQTTLGHKRKTPVVGSIRRVVRGHRAERIKILRVRSGKIRTRTDRHLKLINSICSRHGNTAGTNFRGVSNGYRVGIRIVEVNVSWLRNGRRRTDGRVVGTTPLGRWIQRKPVSGITRTDMTDDEVGLNTLGSRNPPANHDAAVDQIRFALIQNNIGRANTRAI